MKSILVRALATAALLALTACSAGLSAASQPTAPASWQEVAKTVSEKLSEATRLADAGDRDEARDMVSDIYFEIFEGQGMETAIRSNISAKRAFELEELFADMRKGIGDGKNEAVRATSEALSRALLDDASKLSQLGISLSS